MSEKSTPVTTLSFYIEKIKQLKQLTELIEENGVKNDFVSAKVRHMETLESVREDAHLVKILKTIKDAQK